MEEVIEVGKRRLERLRSDHGGAIFEDDYMDTEAGTRGLIRMVGPKDDIIALEFIEPEGVWADPDALEEYAETVEGGIHVTVIVPDADRSEAEAVLGEAIGKHIKVLSYTESASASWM